MISPVTFAAPGFTRAPLDGQKRPPSIFLVHASSNGFTCPALPPKLITVRFNRPPSHGAVFESGIISRLAFTLSPSA